MQDQSEPDGTFLDRRVSIRERTRSRRPRPAIGTPTLPPVTIASESDVPAVDVRLDAGRTVRGRVVDANGNGIAGRDGDGRRVG